MNENELKPCPFCGAPAEMKETSGHDYFVKCTGCGARTRNHQENQNGAVERWNRRKEVRPERVHDLLALLLLRRSPLLHVGTPEA